MTVVYCELTDCESNIDGICSRTGITIQISDPDIDAHECYDYMPEEGKS